MHGDLDRPTLAALRGRAQKGRHWEIGNWPARRLARPSAVYGTWLAVRLGMSAHQVTCLALASSVAGAIALGTGERVGFAAGVILLLLAFWLDHVDGQVARWRGTESLSGVYLDYLMHHAATLVLGFGLGIGLAMRSGLVVWAVAGGAVALGWSILSLHNDCRYKAFFQRLKREKTRYWLDGGAGGRPGPAPGWPRRGLGTLSWPALKLCEGHVVLGALGLLGLVAIMNEQLWESAWAWYVGVMAVLAPGLAAGRVFRAVRRGTVEAEFAAWFRDAGVEQSEDRPLEASEPVAILLDA